MFILKINSKDCNNELECLSIAHPFRVYFGGERRHSGESRAGGLTGLGEGFLTKKYLLAQGAEDAEEEEI